MVKNPFASAGDMHLILELGRSPGEGNGNPLQYSCLENPMDRGTWRATIHEVARKSDTTERLNNNRKDYRTESCYNMDKPQKHSAK